MPTHENGIGRLAGFERRRRQRLADSVDGHTTELVLFELELNIRPGREDRLQYFYCLSSDFRTWCASSDTGPHARRSYEPMPSPGRTAMLKLVLLQLELGRE